MVTMQYIWKLLRKEWILKVLITRKNKLWLWTRLRAVILSQCVLTLSHEVVHLEYRFFDSCLSAVRLNGPPLSLVCLLTSLCFGSLMKIWGSKSSYAFHLDDYASVSCCPILLWVPVVPLLCVRVCAVLDASGSSFITLASSLKGVDTSWTLPPCNQEELPSKPQANLSSESDLGLWSLRVA